MIAQEQLPGGCFTAFGEQSALACTLLADDQCIQCERIGQCYRFLDDNDALALLFRLLCPLWTLDCAEDSVPANPAGIDFLCSQKISGPRRVVHLAVTLIDILISLDSLARKSIDRV